MGEHVGNRGRRFGLKWGAVVGLDSLNFVAFQRVTGRGNLVPEKIGGLAAGSAVLRRSAGGAGVSGLP